MLTELELRPAQIPAHTTELKNALNQALQVEWTQRRGISVESIALNPITLTPEDMQKINQMEDAATMGSNPFMMAGRVTDAQATAMETAAGNPNGAMMGFMGMNMAMGANGGFNAQQMYQAGVQQQQQMTAQQQAQQLIDAQAQAMAKAAAATPAAPANGWKCACGATANGKFCPECGSPKPAEAEGWTCNCGAVNKGKFCQECGKPRPQNAPLYRCDKCGWQPEDPQNPPKFCPECGDRFDETDIVK